MILDNKESDRHKEEGKQYYFKQPRSSMLGKSEQEIYKFFTSKHEMDEDSLPIMSAKAGTALHRLVQAQQYQSGKIVTAEKYVHHEDYNFTGHIDAISAELGIGDIKTVSRNAYAKIKRDGPKAAHVSQVNSYMAATGNHKGYIQYIMREDPRQQLTFDLKYDDAMFQADMGKLERVQKKIQKQLDSGALSYSQLRQGDSLEVLEEEGSKAHQKLVDDTSKIDDMVNYFLYHQTKLDKITGEADKQKIAYTKLFGNDPLNPQARREDRNTIEGMKHGWFGNTRSERTPFGSQVEIGKLHGLSDELIQELVGDAFGLDIETTGLRGKKGSTWEIGMVKGTDGEMLAVFPSRNVMEEGQGMSRYLYEHSAVSELDINYGLPEGVTESEISNFKQQLESSGVEFPKGQKVKGVVAGEARVRAHLLEFMAEAKAKKRNIIISNANFEIDHLQHVMGNTTDIQYSRDYIRARNEARRAEKVSEASWLAGEISREDYFKKMVSGQRDIFGQILVDMKSKSGKIIELGEINKTLNAIAQEKGLAPKTGRFAIGTNIQHLASIFLTQKELHEGLSDVMQQNEIASNRSIQLIRDINSGAIYKDPKSGRMRVKGRGRLKDWEKKYFKTFNNKKEFRALHRASLKKMMESELVQKGTLEAIDPKLRSQILSDDIFNEKALFEELKSELSSEAQGILKKKTKPFKAIDGANSTKMFRQGAVVLGAAALLGAVSNSFKFSGNDDGANTVEGLRHGGWAERSRKLHSDFGSGHRTQEYHKRASEDPTDTEYAPLAYAAGLAVLVRTNWNRPFGKTKVSDLGYLGKLSPTLTNEQVLGRSQATFGDVFLSGLKRAEASFGGFPKSFGVSDLIGSQSYHSADYTVDVTLKQSQSYSQYIQNMTGVSFEGKGVTSVNFKEGQLSYMAWDDVKKEVVKKDFPGTFSLKRLSHDLNQNESQTQLSKALIRNFDVNYTDPKNFPFIPVGGEGFRRSSTVRMLHAYVTESLTKYINLMRDPLEGIRELFPDVNIAASKRVDSTLKAVPKYLGLRGPESELMGGSGEILKKHGARLGVAAGMLYFGFGTLDWATRQAGEAFPVENVAEAGLLGIGAGGIRTAHQTYAKISDMMGLTSFRDSMEEMAPGMQGWQAVTGLALTGAITGGGYSAGKGLVLEGSKAGKSAYQQFIENKKLEEKMIKPLDKIFKGEYTDFGKSTRVGAMMGVALALPWLISGLGADKSFGELEAEYEGMKEVDVRKGRYWEASLTPWEGAEIQYHRPGWYQRLFDDPKTAELYQGEDISPIGKLARSIIDPYWLEKRRYEDQPYPYAGPDGSQFGMFASLYEMSIGRGLKAPVIMHGEELANALRSHRGKHETEGSLGGYGVDPIAPNELAALARQQWATAIEALGLRGFAMGSIKEAITGEKEIGGYQPQLAHAGAMDSVVRDFHELQIGGGILTTEAIRRVLPKEEVGSVERINPLTNRMPSWMPGQGFHTNFHTGDPFAKVKEGYYRLPGEGFATRYKELKGLDPEDYPDVFKYKILADVGYGSQQFKELRGQLQNRVLTPTEMTIFDETEAQLVERADSRTNFRDPATYDSVLGTYAALLTDIARASPLEQLIPLSPAHKFLPGIDPVDAYAESVYGKSFRRWSHPIEDFVMPAFRKAGSLVGITGTPESQEYVRELEDHFDKLEYLKYSRLAEDSKVAGDQGSANMYMQRAEKTMSGLDPYMSEEELLKRLPSSEKGFFKEFVGASERDKEQILGMSSPAMRDIYLAQWDKKALDELQSGTTEMERNRRMQMQQEIKTRAAKMRTKRKAQIQDFSRSSQMPDQKWEGWDRRVDLQDVKMKYLVNEGRDYHNHGLWQDRLNQLSRKPYIAAAAENIKFAPGGYQNRNSQAYEKAREIGIVNPKISMAPGLSEGIDLEVEMHRTGERQAVLKDLGYVI